MVVQRVRELRNILGTIEKNAYIKLRYGVNNCVLNDEEDKLSLSLELLLLENLKSLNLNCKDENKVAQGNFNLFSEERFKLKELAPIHYLVK